MKDIIKILKLLDSGQKKFLFFLFLVSILVVIAEAISLTMILPLISILINPDYFKTIVTDKESILDVLLEKILMISNQYDKGEILTIVMVSFAFIMLLKNILIYYHFSKSTYFIHNVEKNLSKKLLNKYLHQNYLYFVRNPVSHFLTRLVTDLPIVSRGLLGSAITIFTECFMIIVFLILIIWLKLFELGLIFIIFFSMGYIILKILSYINKKLGVKREMYDTEKYKLINNILLNIKFINLYNRVNHFLDKFLQVATNVKACVITRSPGLTPAKSIERCNAAVPFITAIARLDWVKEEIFCSN